MDIRLQLSDNPSKAEELAVWQKFVNSLPRNSYLNIYLEGLDIDIDRAMAADETLEISRIIESNKTTEREQSLERILADAQDKIHRQEERIQNLESNYNDLYSRWTRVKTGLQQLKDI